MNIELNNFSGLQAISWDQRILFSQREAYERSIQSEGYPNFQIFEKNSDNHIVRAGDRPFYVPVGFVEPVKGNERALGFDVYSNPLRQEAIDRATDSGAIAATAPVILAQENENKPGILAYLPIYRKGSSYQTLAQRRDNISGYVAAVFRGEDIVSSALKEVNQEGLGYRVIDEGAAPNEQLIFSNSREPLKPLVLQENGLFGRHFSLMRSLMIPVGGRSWRIDVVPTQHYLVFHRSNNVWLILLGGLLLTSMVSSFVLVFSGRGNRLRQLVDERTMALAQSEERFRCTFEWAPVGVVNSALNGRFLAVNRGYCDLLGYSKDELATMTFQQVTHPDYRQQDIDMIQRVLAGEISSFTVEKKYVRKDGGVIWANLSARLIRDAAGSPNYFVAVIENIDRRKQAEAQIAKSLSLLQATLDSSKDAILVVDLNHTWVLHNQRFIDLWHITDELIAAKDDDAALVYVMDQLNDADVFLKEVHRLYATPEISSFDVLKLKNGKIIERYSIPQRIDGKVVGRVWSFSDITVRKATEELLRKLSLAVEQSPNSVMITDLDANIEYVNEAFVRITGYSRAEAIGKNPRLSHSGKTPKAVYEDMWATLTRGEVWKGEFINRNKDGGEYTGSAFISPVRQQDGKITHYVSVQEDISARKQAESLLQESEKRFRNVADAAPVLIWLGGTDKLYFWFNQVWLDFTGRSLEQEMGDGWTEGVHPDDLSRYRDTYGRHFDRRKPFRMEYRLKRYDGDYRWIDDNGVPRFDVDGSFLGYIGSCIDITDRKLAEQKIAAQHLRYQTLLKSSTDGIHIIDLDGNIVDANEAFCRQLGYSSAETMQLNITQWDAQWPEEELLRILKELVLSGQAKQFETKHRRKDGSVIDVEINAVQVVLEGKPLLFASARDISGRKQNEAVILLAKERAEALAQSKTDFLANMSHEIRTPMNAIIGLSQLALNKELSFEIRDYLEKIYSSSNNLLSILNGILDFSKLEAGRLTIDHSRFGLDTILDNINNLFAEHAKEKDLNLIIDVAPNVPRQLIGDTLRLQQVLINLLGNAIKFTEHGEVKLSITAQQIDLSQARLLFCVSDTGIGISEPDLEKLFHPFSQVDGSITRRFGGTGLGLVISQNLLQLMGSEFSVVSRAGQGSRFSFELVFDVSAFSSRRMTQCKSGAPLFAPEDSGALLTGRRILVAE
ncbi:MAG: PAS domain S-box protein, partial [Methylococcaceae bacterium]